MKQNDQKDTQKTASNSEQKKPNEQGAISVQGFVKIYDPKTKETFVETRA